MSLPPYALPIRAPPSRPASSTVLPTTTAGIKTRDYTEDDGIIARNGVASSGGGKAGAGEESKHICAGGNGIRCARSEGMVNSATRGSACRKPSKSVALIAGVSSATVDIVDTTAITVAATHLNSSGRVSKVGRIFPPTTSHVTPKTTEPLQTNATIFRAGCQASDGQAASTSRMPTPTYRKRGVDEAVGHHLSFPRLSGDRVTSTPVAAARSRLHPSIGPRKRICLKHEAACKDHVKAESILPEVLQAEKLSAISDHTRPNFARAESLSALEQQQQQQSRLSAAEAAHYERSCRGTMQHDSYSIMGRAGGGGERTFGLGASTVTGSSWRYPRDASGPGHAVPSLNMGTLPHADLLHHQANMQTVCGKGGGGGEDRLIKVEAFYSASDATASMSSGDDDCERAHNYGTAFGPEYDHRVHPLTRSAAAALECLTGDPASDIFPTSPFLDVLSEETNAGGAGARSNLDGICLKSPFDLDIPEEICPPAAPNSSNNSNESGGWTSATGTDSASSFFYNDELVFTPSGLVGDGW